MTSATMKRGRHMSQSRVFSQSGLSGRVVLMRSRLSSTQAINILARASASFLSSVHGTVY